MQLLCCSRIDYMNNLDLLYFFISLAHGIHIFPGQMLICPGNILNGRTNYCCRLSLGVVMPCSLSYLFSKTSRLALEPFSCSVSAGGKPDIIPNL